MGRNTRMLKFEATGREAYAVWNLSLLFFPSFLISNKEKGSLKRREQSSPPLKPQSLH